MSLLNDKRGFIGEISPTPAVMALVAGAVTLLMFSVLGKTSDMEIKLWVKIFAPIATIVASYFVFNFKFGD